MSRNRLALVKEAEGLLIKGAVLHNVRELKVSLTHLEIFQEFLVQQGLCN